MKITKTGSDPTYYLKGTTLVRVNDDKSFYIYTLAQPDTTTCNNACSEWKVTVELSKSGSCNTATGVFTPCTTTVKRKGRILEGECVEITLTTLKITKKTSDDGKAITYTLESGSGDNLDGYTTVEDVTKTGIL